MKNNRDSERVEGRLMGCLQEVGDARETDSGMCGLGEGL